MLRRFARLGPANLRSIYAIAFYHDRCWRKLSTSAVS